MSVLRHMVVQAEEKQKGVLVNVHYAQGGGGHVKADDWGRCN